LKRSKTLSPVIPRARFDAQIVIKITKMNGGSFAESHLSRDFAIGVTDALAMLFEKFRELGLRHAEV